MRCFYKCLAAFALIFLTQFSEGNIFDYLFKKKVKKWVKELVSQIHLFDRALDDGGPVANGLIAEDGAPQGFYL